MENSRQKQLSNIVVVTDPDGNETVLTLWSYDIKAVEDFLETKGYDMEIIPCSH
jgi:hypothetical protein